mmetsp:Transcript_22831/g.28310  ORF Transcript_22831/g.28310 Transcript_22831/m.28310 type:complete len:135 (+) Transcript_22831:38-442(+)
MRIGFYSVALVSAINICTTGATAAGTTSTSAIVREDNKLADPADNEIVSLQKTISSAEQKIEKSHTKSAGLAREQELKQKGVDKYVKAKKLLEKRIKATSEEASRSYQDMKKEKQKDHSLVGEMQKAKVRLQQI